MGIDNVMEGDVERARYIRIERKAKQKYMPTELVLV
jgi:hypothetical protein